MVEQREVGGGGDFAKEMERLSAKESMLLALKDAGGFEAVVTRKTTDVQLIDVNERIIALERLNLTPRPTIYPGLPIWKVYGILSGLELQGQCSWQPGFYLSKRIHPTLANLSKLDLLIRNGIGTAIVHVKLLNSIENKFVLSSKFSVEGPRRMKEGYVEGIFETLNINEDTVPEQLKGALDQALQQLPVPLRDSVSRELDEEIPIVRNTAGEPEVLTRLDPAPDPEPISAYES